MRQAAVARARVVAKVRLSAQRSADRSVRRLIPRRHRTAPAYAGLPGHVPAPRRRGNALERTLRLALPRCPPRGRTRKAPAPLRSARAIASSRPYTPSRGLRRSL